MELDLQSLSGLHVHSHTHWLRPRTTPSLSFGLIYTERYWSVKIDDISLDPLVRVQCVHMRTTVCNYVYEGLLS
jgi:hypothetical protein